MRPDKASGQMEMKKADAELLISLGLYEKVYCDEIGGSKEYPFLEWEGQHKGRYYKKRPISITEKEYEMIVSCARAASRQTKNRNKTKNTIALIFTVIGYMVFDGGFTMGLLLSRTVDKELVIGFSMIYWLGALAIGLLALIISEVILLWIDKREEKEEAI